MSLYFGGNGITYTHPIESNKNIFELHNEILYRKIKDEKFIKYLDKNNINYYIYYKPNYIKLIPTNYKNKDCVEENQFYSQFEINISLVYKTLCSLEKRLKYLKKIGFKVVSDISTENSDNYIVHLKAVYEYRQLSEYKYKAIIKVNDDMYEIFIKDNINILNRLRFKVMNNIHKIVNLT